MAGGMTDTEQMVHWADAIDDSTYEESVTPW